MRKRISKKLHNYWLGLEVIDLSQDSYWRKKLFEAAENETFEIDKNNVDHLPKKLVQAILKYNLKFNVAKVDGTEAEPWLSENGMIVFKFWAAGFSNLQIFYGNNPDII
jgi:hypothetical protein